MKLSNLAKTQVNTTVFCAIVAFVVLILTTAGFLTIHYKVSLKVHNALLLTVLTSTYLICIYRCIRYGIQTIQLHSIFMITGITVHSLARFWLPSNTVGTIVLTLGVIMCCTGAILPFIELSRCSNPKSTGEDTTD